MTSINSLVSNVSGKDCDNGPLFSVIIPLYNKAPFIKRTLDSILSQTVQDFEIIVVNDGSQDGGDKNVEEYDDSRIYLFNQTNQGVSSARNTGISKAKGKYICFLDADDEWMPEYLETISNLIFKYPDAGGYATSFYLSDNTGVNIRKICKGIDGDDDGIYSDFFMQCIEGGRIINSSTATVPRDVFSVIGLFNTDAKEFEDHDIWCRIALFYDIVATTTPQVVCHTECSTYQERVIKNKVPTEIPFETYIRSLDKNIISTHVNSHSIKEYIDYMHLVLAHRSILNNEKVKARRLLRDITIRKHYPHKIQLYILSFIPSGIYSCGLTVGSRIMRLIR